MADVYSTLGLPSDPQDALQEMIEDFQARIPGWVPADGAYEVALMEVVALATARVAAAMEDTARDAFRSFGQEIAEVPPVVDEHAYATVTFTASHTDGVLLEAGTALKGSDGSGGDVYFQTTQSAVIVAGSSSISGVPVEAIDAGLLAGPVSGTGSMVTAVDGITTVTFDVDSTLGSTAESDDAYTNRLTRVLRLLKAGPVTPDDYDLFIRTQIPAAYRVLVRDQYNPTTDTSGVANTVMLSIIDASGAWVGSGVDLDATNLLAAVRETNAGVTVVPPTVTTIDVHYSVIVTSGYTASEVLAFCDAAVANYLSPASWGSPRTGTEPAWNLKTTLRPMGMLGPVIGNVEGVESVEAVTARTGANAFATTAITLTGDAPLTTAGVIVGTSV